MRRVSSSQDLDVHLVRHRPPAAVRLASLALFFRERAARCGVAPRRRTRRTPSTPSSACCGAPCLACSFLPRGSARCGGSPLRKHPASGIFTAAVCRGRAADCEQNVTKNGKRYGKTATTTQLNGSKRYRKHERVRDQGASSL